MLKLNVEEIDKIISVLEWVQIATLAGQDEKEQIKKILDKLSIAKKFASNNSIEISAK